VPPHGPARLGRWLLAGGLAGAALSPPLARLRRTLGRRLAGAAPVTDPVAPFTEAPCYAEDRRAAAGTGDRTERVG
jgi:hypothetical protein